jgi:anthranilate 1,2-dioxygenase large subunit
MFAIRTPVKRRERVDQASPTLIDERIDWQKTLSRVPYGAFQAVEIYRREQEHLFHGPLWHFLCLEVEVAQGGDFRTCKVGDTPVIVSRDYDGEIYAYENLLRPPRSVDLS